jgi:hypothetical protein
MNDIQPAWVRLWGRIFALITAVAGITSVVMDWKNWFGYLFLYMAFESFRASRNKQ